MKKSHDTDWPAFFDQRAKDFSDPVKSADWSRFGFTARHRFVENALPAGSRVPGYRLLDCGCGVGHYLQTACDLGAHPVGFDLSENMLRRAKEKGVFCVRGHAENLPFRAESFDVILAIGILQYLDTGERCIGQMAPLLKPDGMLALVTLSRQSLAIRSLRCRRKKSIRAYGLDEIAAAIIGTGLSIIESRYLYLFPSGFDSLASILNQNRYLNRMFPLFAHAICLLAVKKHAAD